MLVFKKRFICFFFTAFLIGASGPALLAYPLCEEVDAYCNIDEINEKAYVSIFAYDENPCNIRGNVTITLIGNGSQTFQRWAQATIGQGSSYDSISLSTSARFCRARYAHH